MKKVLAIAAVAGMAVFASCGDDAAEKAKQDSLRQDSIDKANQHVTDSVNAAKAKDSADKAAAMQMEADKMKHMADSLHEDSVKRKLIKTK